ncbi:MAG: hypothetical protein ACKV0T_06710 [Planctomycetales bacterium]
MIGASGVTSQTLQEVAALPALEELHLWKNRLDDACLMHLETTRLKKLVLTDTQVTEQGILRLARSLSECRIEWDGPILEPGNLSP